MHTRIIRHHPGSELQALGMTGPLTLELSSRWPACPPAENSRVFLVPYRGSRAMLCSSSGVLLLLPQTGKGRPPFALLDSSRVPLSMQMQLKPQAWQMLSSVAERQAAHQHGLAVLEGEDLLSIQTVHLQEAREHISKKPCASAAGTEHVTGVHVVARGSACGALPCRSCWGSPAQQLTTTVQSSEQLATNSTVSSKLRSWTAPS